MEFGEGVCAHHLSIWDQRITQIQNQCTKLIQRFSFNRFEVAICDTAAELQTYAYGHICVHIPWTVFQTPYLSAKEF